MASIRNQNGSNTNMDPIKFLRTENWSFPPHHPLNNDHKSWALHLGDYSDTQWLWRKTHQLQNVVDTRRGNIRRYADILNSMPLKTCRQPQTHHSMIQNQAHRQCITKPGCFAAFDDLVCLLKFSAVFIRNYEQMLWTIDIVVIQIAYHHSCCV